MYSMGVLMDTSLDGRLDGHKPGMYSLGVLVVVVEGHKSGPGRKACVLTVLAARDGLQHIRMGPCLPALPTENGNPEALDCAWLYPS